MSSHKLCIYGRGGPGELVWVPHHGPDVTVWVAVTCVRKKILAPLVTAIHPNLERLLTPPPPDLPN